MKTQIGYDEDDGGEEEPPDSSDGGNEEPPEPPPVGQEVIVIDGPFTDFEGSVEKVDSEKAKVRVRINFFGRDTHIELDFGQVKKLEVEPNKDN